MSTRFLQDIIRQPAEMLRTIDYLTGQDRTPCRKATALIRSARRMSSSPASEPVGMLLSVLGLCFIRADARCIMQEAGELLHFTAIPRGTVIVAISRTGRSIEIVQVLAKAKASGAAIIGITNCADSPLAHGVRRGHRRSDHARPWHFSQYLFHAIDCRQCFGQLSDEPASASVAGPLIHSVEETGRRLQMWQDQLEESSWLIPDRPVLFPRPWWQLRNLPRGAIAVGRRGENARYCDEHERVSPRPPGDRQGRYAGLHVDRSSTDA